MSGIDKKTVTTQKSLIILDLARSFHSLDQNDVFRNTDVVFLFPMLEPTASSGGAALFRTHYNLQYFLVSACRKSAGIIVADATFLRYSVTRKSNKEYYPA